MLKKIGLSGEYYSVKLDDKNTVASLTVPLSIITEDNVVTISTVLMDEIKNLPQFPEHVMELQKKLKEADVDIKQISILISRDPGLTAEILRFSNSALYSLPKKLSSLLEAIKIIGLRGLNNIVFTYETQKILGSKYDIKKMQEIWDHSYKVAFFAFYFGKKNLPREDLEDIYIGGILHDLGKILTFSINPEVMEKMNFVCQEKGISLRIIEEIVSGYNHALIGALMAKKWNFPDKLVSVIEHHLNPFGGDEKYRNFIFCIYLANIMVKNFDTLQEEYLKTDKEVLFFFRIKTFEEFKSIAQELNKEFELQKNRTT